MPAIGRLWPSDVDDAGDECGAVVGGGSNLRRTIGDDGAAGVKTMLSLVVIVMLVGLI